MLGRATDSPHPIGRRLPLALALPDALIAEATGVPSDWVELAFGLKAREFGDRWALERASVALLVPSVVLPPGA